VIGNTEWDRKREKEYIRHLIQKQVDGFILASTSLSAEYINQLAEKNIPMVVLDREFNSDQIDKIRINDYKGGYQAAKHLIKCGYDYFVHLKGVGFTVTASDRAKGFKDCMQENSIKKTDYKILLSSFVEEEAAEQMATFLDRNNFENKKIGIFAANDAAAFGVLKELKRRKINVPQKAGVIGFDNVNFAEYSSPSLTTINRSIADVGELSAAILLERLNKNENEKIEHKNMMLDVELIKRESTTQLI
jgi:LacI family transcriptional regulator